MVVGQRLTKVRDGSVRTYLPALQGMRQIKNPLCSATTVNPQRRGRSIWTAKD